MPGPFGLAGRWAARSRHTVHAWLAARRGCRGHEAGWAALGATDGERATDTAL
jgi:hypothetical protein